METYELKHQLNLGGKIVDSVTIRRLNLGDFYGFKDLNNMGIKEIGSLICSMTGLSEPEVKRLDLEDVGFLSQKAESFMAAFQ